MYGPMIDYLPKTESKQAPKATIYTRHRPGVSMVIHNEKGKIWIHAKRFWGKVDDETMTMNEFLVCENFKLGLFKLTGRYSGGKVPMTVVTRRQLLFPSGILLRLNLK